jgi:hypothetical protein
VRRHGNGLMGVKWVGSMACLGPCVCVSWSSGGRDISHAISLYSIKL